MIPKGDHQHSRKRDKFQQAHDLVDEIRTISVRMVDAMDSTQSVPIMDVAMLHAKVSKLWALFEVRRDANPG